MIFSLLKERREETSNSAEQSFNSCERTAAVSVQISVKLTGFILESDVTLAALPVRTLWPISGTQTEALPKKVPGNSYWMLVGKKA